MGQLDALMCKPTSSTPLAAFLFVDSWWHEQHDAVQCRALGSTFKFLFEFQIDFFSNFLFEFQVVRASNRFDCRGSTVFCFIFVKCLFHLCTFIYVKFVWYLFRVPHHHWLTDSISYIMCKYVFHMFHLKFHMPSPSGSFLLMQNLLSLGVNRWRLSKNW